MSDTGGTQAASIEVDVTANTQTALKDLQSFADQLLGVGQKVVNVGGQFKVMGNDAGTALDEVGNKTQVTASKMSQLGSLGVNSLSSLTNTAMNLNRAFGSTSPLQPLVNGLMAVSGPLTTFQSELDQSEGKMSKFKTTAMGLSGIGAIFTGIAGAVSAISAPLQTAQASLANSIANTTNASTGAADSISNYTQQLKSAIDTSSQFGFNSAQVTNALGQLTEETRSAPEAFKELQFAETLSAAMSHNTANGYVDLSQAAALVGRMHAGLFRSLRQFGIDMPSMLINPAKEAEKAEKDLANATAALQTAQQNLSDYQARLAQAEEDRQKKAAAAVTTAEREMEAAQQRYQDALEAVSAAQQRSTEASDNATQKQQENAQKLAQDQENAAQKVADAQTKLDDLRQQFSDQDTQRAQTAAEQQQQAADTMQSALASFQSMADQWEETPARTAQAQLQRLDQMRKAAAAYEDAQAKAAKAGQSGELTPEQQLQRQEQLTAAQEALNKALQDQANLGEEATKMQQENAAAQQTAATAAEAYAKAQEQAARAQSAQQVSQDKLTKAQDAQGTAGDPTLAENQQLSKLQDDVKKQQDAINAAKALQVEATQDQQRLDAAFQSAENQFMSREQGLLQRRSETWAGHLRRWAADVENFAMDMGKYAAPLAMVGLTTTGIGSLMNFGQKVKQIFGGIKENVKQGGDEIQQAEDELSQGSGGGGSGLTEHLDDVGTKSERTKLKTRELAEDLQSSGKKFEDTGHKIAGIGGDLKTAETAAGDAEKVMGDAGHLGKIGESAMGLVSKFGGMATGITSTISELGPMLASPVGIAIGVVAAIGLIVYEIVEHWAGFSKFFEDLWGDVERIAKNAWGAISGFFSHLWTDIESTAKSVWGDILGFFKSTLGQILMMLTPVGWVNLIAQHWHSIAGALSGAFTDVINWFENLPDTLWNIIVGMDKKILSIGTHIVEGIWNGISSMGGQLWNWVEGFVKDNIENPVLKFFGLASPSRLMMEHGKNIAQGLANGILSNTSSVADATDRMVKAGTPSMTQLGALAGGVASNGLSGSSQVVINMPLQVQGNVVTEKDLQSNLKTFLQQGAMSNGGLTRFLGVPNA